MTEWILFVVLSVIAIGSAVMMLVGRNPVHCALWLVLTFFCVAGFFLTLGAPFLAAVQIIVYTGAIMILFLFVVMLVNPEREGEPAVPASHRRAGLTLAAVLLVVMVGAITTRSGLGAIPTEPGGVTLRQVGTALLTEWMLPFELTSVLLLVAMIGAIVLARRRIE
ncbi:MAG: NADH-quinone oxidoreductase subunit J [Armatimonadetes bacterium]|jgi:NADH-quinone oxidoreductase subunit J|nr:NADH-quinone oxidoreductase subunit J [Armatimonadota bacterium]